MKKMKQDESMSCHPCILFIFVHYTSYTHLVLGNCCIDIRGLCILTIDVFREDCSSNLEKSRQDIFCYSRSSPVFCLIPLFFTQMQMQIQNSRLRGMAIILYFPFAILNCYLTILVEPVKSNNKVENFKQFIHS